MDGRVTNGLRVGWVTPLAFYENRTVVLRSLENRGELHRFFVREEDTGAQIGKPHHELRIGARGILAVLFPPEESAEPVLDAIRLACETMSPKRISSVSIFTQHVHGLDGSYEESRRSLALSVVQGIADRTQPNDCAVLFDGAWSMGDLSMEFGVVNEEEIKHRLLGGVGRAHPPRDALSVRRLPEGLPPVALYMEANRTVTSIPSDLDPAGCADFLLEAWSVAAEDSDEVATLLLDRSPVRGSHRAEGAGAW